MNAAIYVVTFIVTAAGIVFSVWSYIDTRKRYYNEFVKRKSKREKLHLS